MASVCTEKSGARLIRLSPSEDTRRPKIRLGKVSKRDAESVRAYVVSLLRANQTGNPIPPATADWLGRIPDTLRKRLETLGIIEPRERVDCPTLAHWIDQYVKGRSDVKSATATTYGNARRNVVAFFGGNTSIADITAHDTREFKAHLITPKSRGGEGLSENTARKRCSIAKQFFAAALRKRLISENPFVGLPCSVRENKSRFFFITPAIAADVLDACPDIEWKLIFALARYGGLRCPSEILRLRWEDILWDKDRFWVHASKTEHHENGGLRQVPLFPELRGLMLDAFEEAQPGEEYVIASYRGGETNLRTQLTKIIKRAGHEPWPKLFQNLRSTRETELIREHGIAAACEWVGNTPLIALKHYAQVTEEDVQRAAGKACQAKGNGAGLNPGHNPGQTAFADDCEKLPEKPRQSASQAVGKSWQKKTPICNSRQGQSMGHTGLEPVTSRV